MSKQIPELKSTIISEVKLTKYVIYPEKLSIFAKYQLQDIALCSVLLINSFTRF